MPSPFPGMDPYLEAHWRDVHARLIIYASDAIQGTLPGGLRARVEERVVLQSPQGWLGHGLFPDVRVVDYGSQRESEGQAGVAIAEPLLIDLPDPASETYLEIIDHSSGNQVVTVIEFLSPSNKIPGANREQYLRKQGELLVSDTNLVEVDLIRQGVHTLAFPLEEINLQYRAASLVCVRRATQRIRAEVYRLPLEQRLPVIKIPLRPSDADVTLDLQALIEQCYRNGGYAETLNYAADAEPALLGGAAAWADELLREKGLRPPKKPRRKGKPKE